METSDFAVQPVITQSVGFSREYPLHLIDVAGSNYLKDHPFVFAFGSQLANGHHLANLDFSYRG